MARLNALAKSFSVWKSGPVRFFGSQGWWTETWTGLSMSQDLKKPDWTAKKPEKTGLGHSWFKSNLYWLWLFVCNFLQQVALNMNPRSSKLGENWVRYDQNYVRGGFSTWFTRFWSYLTQFSSDLLEFWFILMAASRKIVWQCETG